MQKMSLFFKIFLLLRFFTPAYGEGGPPRALEPTEYSRDSIVKITVKGFNDESRRVTVRGKGFFTEDRKGQIRVVTSFHIIDELLNITSITGETRQHKKFPLNIQALSSFYDVAFLVPADQIKMKKPLLLRKQFPLEGERFYLPFQDGQIVLIYSFYKPVEAELIFLMNKPPADLDGLSGTPIMDGKGRTVALFNSWFSYRGFGTSANLLTYRENKDFVVCTTPYFPQQCILKARYHLLEKTSVKDKRIQRAARRKFWEMYNNNLRLSLTGSCKGSFL